MYSLNVKIGRIQKYFDIIVDFDVFTDRAIDACLATVFIHISCVKARRPCPSGSTNKGRGT